MALVVGENTWATVAQADEYLTNRLGTQDWFTINGTPSAPGEPSKETFLAMAYNVLLNKPGYCLSAGLTDTNVIYAQIELAWYFVNNFTTFEVESNQTSKGLKKFDASLWSEEYAKMWSSDYPLPMMVLTYLTEYMSDNLIVDLEID